ncbi:MAG: Hsp20/alpha crystallin family protein [Candidatus Kapabacteria bacterium]|nr:Hsp20/alpha crystallin family protein [Candidatus Kapabacteria bacterium]MBX7155164.1 Hsp20/alpha crystallin family protein [Bacteroidota bacterium]
MKLVRVNPFAEFDAMTRRMFNDIDRGGVVFNRSNFTQPVLTPRVDVAEDKSNFYINAELAGMSKEDVKIAVNEDRVLTISGEKKQEEKTEDKNYFRVERRYGNFSRSFNIPETVDVANIAAKFENGVLHLTLPKTEPAKPSVTEITIQ